MTPRPVCRLTDPPSGMPSPMSAELERNLLFGTIACQKKLVSPEQFITAMGLWAQRPQTSLSQVLLEQHSLLHGDVHEIDQLLEQRVAEHGGDLTLCLQSVATGEQPQAINELQTL